MTDIKKMLDLIVKAADGRQAEGITVLDVQEQTTVAEYFMICSGNSTPQIKAISGEIEKKLKEEGVMPLHVEGYVAANWILMDYGSIVIHIFHKEMREFYNLERLWQDSKVVEKRP